MKEIFSSKIFKATAIFVVIVALVTTAVNVTIAFFTDAKESTGVFTAGNVYISLTEAAIKSDGNGNLIRDPDADRIQGSELGGTTDAVHDYGVVFPGQTIFKDPTVKNTGDNNAWVAIKVIIEQGAGCDLHELFGYNDDYDDINIKLLLDGGLLAESSYVGDWNGIPNACYNDKYVMLQVSNRSTGKYEFFFIMKNPMVKDELWSDNESIEERERHRQDADYYEWEE